MAKQVIKKEKENECQTSLDQSRNDLSKKYKRLLEISIGKGKSNQLATLLISDFGFEVSKKHFWDAAGYGMDGALKMYQQNAPVVVDFVYKIA